jgi:hypothetical protein
LQVLKDADASAVEIDQIGGEDSKLLSCNVGAIEEAFLGLFSDTNKLYIREGYGALLTLMKELWKNRRARRVTLLGNAGTGKSWYQVYVLRELLRDRDGFKYVIRQVAKIWYLIDLEECKGYQWVEGTFSMKTIFDQMKDTLYLYEPGEEKSMSPMALLALPSLATLSPFAIRIAEYKKAMYSELYFWPWSFSAMHAVVQDSGLKLSPEELLKRYSYFGGIARHVLAESDKRAMDELVMRLANVSLEVLQSKAINIDRVQQGGNVSGYILCYNNQHEDSRFTERALEYTSVFVESKVEQILDAIPLKEKAQTVLKRLNNEAVDLSGKSLEAVGTEFLSRGSHGTKYKWESKRVGTSGAWSAFTTTKRKVVRLWDIRELLSRQGQIIVSTSTNFPLGDIVFSRNTATDPIDVIQFTWQLKHPFTIRALYDLRVKRLEVSHEVSVRVYMISPHIEDTYVSMNEINFLKGSLVKPFEYSKTSGVTPPADLQNMWNNTEVHVIRPKTAWGTLLVDFVTSGS